MSDPLTLARMRALRTIDVPIGDREYAAINDAARHAARRIIDVADPTRGRALMLAWEAGYDPGTVAADAGNVREAAPTVLLVLAACIRCCWPDHNEPLHPGQTATETDVFDALESFMCATNPRTAVPVGVRNARWRALRRLRACGLLSPDVGDGTVRLGPELAHWTAADIAQLRSRYDSLPAPQRSTP